MAKTVKTASLLYQEHDTDREGIASPSPAKESPPADFDSFESSFVQSMQAAIDRQKEAEKSQRQLEREAKAAQAEIDAALARKAELVDRADAAARQAKDAALEQKRIERSKPAPPIDADRARKLANRLIKAWDAVPERDRTDDDLRQFWFEVDEVACLTLTREVSAEARPAVLALDAVIRALEEWELARRHHPHDPPSNAGTIAGDTATTSPLLQATPAESTVVRRLVAELRAVVAGTFSRKKLETVGELLEQNVSLRQATEMLQLQRLDGRGDLRLLADIIDHALQAVGFYDEISGAEHLSRYGGVSLEHAWLLRQDSVPQRRERHLDARENPHRLGVKPLPPQDGTADPAQFLFAKTLQTIAREKAEAKDRLIEQRRQHRIDEAEHEAEMERSYLR